MNHQNSNHEGKLYSQMVISGYGRKLLNVIEVFSETLIRDQVQARKPTLEPGCVCVRVCVCSNVGINVIQIMITNCYNLVI